MNAPLSGASSEIDDKARRAASFGAGATAYAAARPDYPLEAARFLTGARPCTVVELGAGTGKLTARLLELGHDVLATDPSRDMLRIIKKHQPSAHLAVGTAEQIPRPTSSVDVVVAAQCFHWFDHQVALPEIARVLRPGGILALVWNIGDHQVPWVRRLDRLMGRDEGFDPEFDPFEDSDLFELESRSDFRHWQLMHRDSMQAYAASTSSVAILDERERAKLIEQTGELYDDYGRGPDGMLYPWHARCFRGRVSRLTTPEPTGRSTPVEQTDDLLVDFL